MNDGISNAYFHKAVHCITAHCSVLENRHHKSNYSAERKHGKACGRADVREDMSFYKSVISKKL